MMRFICGETGSGKTKSMTGWLIDELQSSNRPIVHCMPLKLQPWVNAKGIAYLGLLQTLEREFGETYDAERRIVELTKEEEIQKFWLCRPRIPEDPQEPREIIWLKPDPEGRFRMDGREHSGVAFFICEAHEYFPAEKWGLMIASGARSWASQNRRAGDDAWIESQFPEQVAKPFRKLSVRCRIMTNHNYLNWGPWRQPDIITFKEYRATPPDKADPPLTGGKIEWKRQLLEGCYDTGGGAGVSGSVADIGKRAKGLHWATLPMLVFGLFILACLSLAGCRKVITNALRGKSQLPVVAHAPASTNAQANLDDYIARAIARALHSNAPNSTHAPRPSDFARSSTNVVIAVTGSPGAWAVMFDDGLIMQAQWVKESGRAIMVDGISYPRGAMVSPRSPERSDKPQR